MKKIFLYLKTHIQKDWNALLYLSVTLFIGLCIFLNYFYFGLTEGRWITIERYFVQTFYFKRSLWTIPVFFIYYAFPYFFVVGIYVLIKKDYSFVKNKMFWLKSLLGILVMAIYLTNHTYTDLTQHITTVPERYWARKTIASLLPWLYLGLPLFVIWWWYDRRKGMPNFYGLAFKGFDWKPYAAMLLLIFPFMFWISFQPSFLKFYPTLKASQIEGITWLPTWLAATTYELAYGIHFIWAEVFYRGFLVIGMAALMGRSAILPMVAFYAFCHFGKPMGETISSVFGGYILGVIALESRNIMGGVWIHMGIAMLMDILAWLHQ